MVNANPCLPRVSERCRAAAFLICSSLLLWGSLMPARAQTGSEDERFLKEKYKPLLVKLATARQLEQQGDLEKASELFESAAGNAQGYAGHDSEHEDGGMRKRPDINSDSINGDAGPFVPRMIAGYAYFEAARLSANEEKKRVLFPLSAAFFNIPKNRRNHYMDIYSLPLFHKIALFGELERYRHRERLSDKQKKRLEEVLDLLAQILADEKNAKTLDREKQQLKSVGNVVTLVVDTNKGISEQNFHHMEEVLAEKLIQDVHKVVTERIDWPRLTDLKIENSRFSLRVDSPFPVPIVREENGKPEEPLPFSYRLQDLRPEADIRIRIKLGMEDPLYRVCQLLHPDFDPANLVKNINGDPVPKLVRSGGIRLRTVSLESVPMDAVRVSIPRDAKVRADASGVATNIQVRVFASSSAHMFAYEVTKAATHEVVAKSDPRKFNPEDREFTVDPLPPGEYDVKAKVWSADTPDPSHPDALDTAKITVLAPPGGMAFIVAIDYYPDQPLRWITAGARELTQKLIERGYREENIVRIYGRLPDAEHGNNPFVEVYPEEFRTSLQSQLAHSPTVTHKLLRDAFTHFLSIAGSEDHQTMHILVYFGGHGEGGENGKEDHLLLPDSTEEAIPVGEWPETIFKTMAPSGMTQDLNLNVVGFFDACRQKAKSDRIKALIDYEEHCCIFQSCSANETSSTDDDKGSYGLNHSFFAKALLDSIDQTKGMMPGQLDTGTLYRQMRETLEAAKAEAKMHGWTGKQTLPNPQGNTFEKPWYIPEMAAH